MAGPETTTPTLQVGVECNYRQTDPAETLVAGARFELATFGL
jgi:hypothetical protein